MRWGEARHARDPSARLGIPLVEWAGLTGPLAACLARFLFPGRFLLGALMVVSPSRRLSVHLGVLPMIAASKALLSIAQSHALPPVLMSLLLALLLMMAAPRERTCARVYDEMRKPDGKRRQDFARPTSGR